MAGNLGRGKREARARMPQVIFSTASLRDLERLREFLRHKNPAAAKRTAVAIINAIQVLARHPQIGKPSGVSETACRELPIDFGDSGYIALYRYDGQTVVILAVRHQRESGF